MPDEPGAKTNGAAAEGAAASRPRRWRPSLTTLIFAGLLAGLAAGLFLGEWCARLKVIADVYIGLLQMTVLPFIIVSIVLNIGGLSRQTAGRLAGRTGLLLVGSWLLIAALIALVAPIYPALESASFFSTSLIAQKPEVDLVVQYVPSNLFRSLSSNVVPAVVLFSLAVGGALIAVERKDALLQQLRAINDALVRLNTFLIRLTPIGVFAIAANAAGTLTIEELGRLQAYLIVHVGCSSVLIFVLLPGLIAATTPFSYRDIFAKLKDILVTAFAIDSLFVVLPMLTKRTNSLFQEHDAASDEVVSTIEVVVPVAYSFPSLGKLVSLTFIPFAAWFSGQPLALLEYPSFLVSGVLSYFGATSVAVPFLLDQQQLPSDLFQLFLVAGLLVGRVGTLVATMSLTAIAILAAALMGGCARLRPVALSRCLLTTAAAVVVLVIAGRIYLGHAMKGAYYKDKVIQGMFLLVNPLPATVLETPAPNPVPRKPGETALERVRRRGILRVGVFPDALPFSYRNSSGDLVGLTVDMAHGLARDLGLELEFVPAALNPITEQFADDHFDVVMGPLPLIPPLFERLTFSDPFMDVHFALAVRDHARKRFATLENIRRMGHVRIGIPTEQYFGALLHEVLPAARTVVLPSARVFFESPPEDADVDAILVSAEAGAAWTLLYPSFQVVIPDPVTASLPLAFPAADEQLARFLSHWIDLERATGRMQEFYDHWILGLSAEPKQPRWCIARDVLGWTD